MDGPPEVSGEQHVSPSGPAHAKLVIQVGASAVLMQMVVQAIPEVNFNPYAVVGTAIFSGLGIAALDPMKEYLRRIVTGSRSHETRINWLRGLLAFALISIPIAHVVEGPVHHLLQALLHGNLQKALGGYAFALVPLAVTWVWITGRWQVHLIIVVIALPWIMGWFHCWTPLVSCIIMTSCLATLVFGFWTCDNRPPRTTDDAVMFVGALLISNFVPIVWAVNVYGDARLASLVADWNSDHLYNKMPVRHAMPSEYMLKSSRIMLDNWGFYVGWVMALVFSPWLPNSPRPNFLVSKTINP